MEVCYVPQEPCDLCVCKTTDHIPLLKTDQDLILQKLSKTRKNIWTDLWSGSRCCPMEEGLQGVTTLRLQRRKEQSLIGSSSFWLPEHINISSSPSREAPALSALNTYMTCKLLEGTSLDGKHCTHVDGTVVSILILSSIRRAMIWRTTFQCSHVYFETLKTMPRKNP